ncbi:hypothetical protein Nwat_0549 [Nitrosococcus watsonii C-113]|uniref:Uncharacterized protein n=1 Tax=Nitrosococcus watsoni (strain C-113) TaxID=105559 RepID=D8KAX8_NITWC|nr:hypothetical protein Nwat_0549 [Nitrosococcus watsonii C-113]
MPPSEGREVQTASHARGAGYLPFAMNGRYGFLAFGA